MSAAVIRYSWHSTPRVLRACAGGGDMAAHAPDDPMLVSGGGGNAVCDAALDDFPSSVLAALPDVGSSPSAAFARLQPEAGAPQSAVALRVAPAGEPVTPLPAEQDFLSSLYAAPGFLPDITALAEKLDSAARTAVARALEGAESLAFDGEEFSRFRQAQLSLTEPSAATLERLGLTGCYGAVPSPPPFDANATVELLQNAWANALSELGGLYATTAAAAHELGVEARVSSAATVLEGAARDTAAAGETLRASAAAAAGRLRTATEASGEDLRSAVTEAAGIGHAHAHAAAVAVRSAATAELSAVAAQASTVAAALATESAALEHDVALRASEALARGTGLAEAALEEAAANAAAALSGASPAQRLAAEVDAAAIFVNECAADVLDSLRNDPLSRWSGDLLDAQITLAASSDAAFSQATARAAAAAAEMQALAADAMETTAGVLEGAQDGSIEFVNGFLAGNEPKPR